MKQNSKEFKRLAQTPLVPLQELAEFLASLRVPVTQAPSAETCELCGATDKIEVHNIRKLSDLDRGGRSKQPRWTKIIAARHRMTLIVCQACHHAIQYGRYEMSQRSRTRVTGEPPNTESGQAWFGGGPLEKYPGG